MFKARMEMKLAVAAPEAEARATVGFTLVLIAVGLATAFVKAHNPGLRIIGIILGSFGYTYGSLLGVFIVALFTKTHGSETGNMIAMASGMIAVALLSNLPNDVSEVSAEAS